VQGVKLLVMSSCPSVATKNTNSQNISDPESFEGKILVGKIREDTCSYVEAITDLDI